MKKLFPAVQKLGRSLMLPIAVLPVAGLLLRLGQPDLLDLPYVAAAGNAVFANLGMLFAIGVAVGLARGNNGAAGLAAVVAYLVTTEGAKVLVGVPPAELANASGQFADLLTANYKDAAINKLSVPAGLICGILSGAFYNRFSDIRLPDYLAFFAGRRFVPIISGFAALLLAAVFGFGWPVLEQGMNSLSEGVVGAGGAGLFVYGLLNRLLIITGLHHILNNIAWFIVGDFEGVTGDLRRFFAGDPAAGAFMTGFFPVMMFGLPAACLAMYHCAAKEKRKAVGGLLLSMGLTSFLTGITEPIEFTFMFLAPVLYGLHAVLTGLSMVVMDLFNIRHGFGFSAGLFDYVLNFNRATAPLMIIPVGAVYFVIYYLVFRWFILRFDVPTPGRAADEPTGLDSPLGSDAEAIALVDALGGAANLLEIDACTTRLRLRVANQEAIDEGALKALGAAGMLRPTPDTVQVVMGLRADELANNMREVTGSISAPTGTIRPDPRRAPPTAVMPASAGTELLEALGGAKNIIDMEAIGDRLSLRLKDVHAADEGRLMKGGFRGMAMLGDGRVHVLADGDVSTLALRLSESLNPS
ncbi:N-acetylglucosamine-specific PTS transporter subunit IIBC [Pseudomonadota bacterium]|jgi:PTS system N-acetylglucosamine-specific IIC component